MCLCGLRLKKHIIFHILYIIVAPLCPTLLKRVDFYKEHRSEKRGVLWLASYPVRCDWPNTSSVRRKCYAPYRIVMLSLRDDTKTIKPIINEAFVASSGDIITDYNDLYRLFTHRVASRHVNITMSAFVIGETTNNKHYSTQLKARVWIVSGRNVLTGCESETTDCPCKVGIAPLYRNSLCASQHCRLLFQVREIVLHKMRCTHSNIWVELFWNSVVNTT